MLVADLNILPDEDYKWVRSLLQHSVEYAQKYPDKDLVGLSINASGPAEPMPLEDLMSNVDIPKYALPKLAEAKDKGVTNVRVVNQLTEAMSCDLVTRAGAGGRVLEMLEKEMNKMSKKEEKKEEKEMEKKEAEGVDHDGGHDDAEQDKALIAKMLKKHLGDDATEEDMQSAQEAYEHLMKADGMKHDEAMKMAAGHMKLAKAMLAKKEAAKKEAEEKKAEADKADKEDKMMDESAEEKKEEGKKESEFLRLKGEVASLREALRKQDVEKHLEKKLAQSGLPRTVTKAFKESIGQPKTEAEIDRALAIFMEGYKATRGLSGALNFVHGNEKRVSAVTESNGKLSFADCVKE
jgi:hypothetical protein